MFASNKIVSILLYVIFGVSVLIIGFFYFGDNLIDEAAYNAKVTKLETSDDSFSTPMGAVQEPEAAVSDSLVSDSAAVKPAPIVAKPPVAPVKVEFSFLEKLNYYKTDIALGWAYILVGLTLLLAIGFSFAFMFSSVKNMVRALGVLAIAAVIVGIAYLFSSGAPISIPGFEGTDNSNPGVLKFVDTAMFTTYFLIGLALLSILYSEVSSYFK